MNSTSISSSFESYSTLLDYLEPEERAQILVHAREVFCQVGQTVLKEAYPNTLYLVKEGEISLRSPSQLDFGRVIAGRVIELRALISESPNWNWYWRAEQESTLLAIPWSLVLEAFKKKPLLFHYLLRIVQAVELQKLKRDLRIFGFDQEEIIEIVGTLKYSEIFHLLQNPHPFNIFAVMAEGEIEIKLDVHSRRRSIALLRVGDHAVVDLTRPGHVIEFKPGTSVWAIERSAIAQLKCAKQFAVFVDSHSGVFEQKSQFYDEATVWTNALELASAESDAPDLDSVTVTQGVTELVRDKVEMHSSPAAGDAKVILQKPWQTGSVPERHRKLRASLKSLPPVEQSWAYPAAILRLGRYHNLDLGLNTMKKAIVGLEDSSGLEALLPVLTRLGLRPRIRTIDEYMLKYSGEPALATYRSSPVILHGFEHTSVVVEFPDTGKRHHVDRARFARLSGAQTLMISPDATAVDVPDPFIPLSSYMKTIRGGVKRSFYLFLATGLSFIFDLTIPMLLQIFFSRILDSKRWAIATVLIACYAGVRLFSVILGRIEQSILLALHFKMEAAFASAYLNHLVRLPIQFYDFLTRGDLLSRYEEIGASQSAMTSFFVSIIANSLSILCCATILWFFNPQLVYVVAAVLPVLLTVKLILGLASRRATVGLQRYLAVERSLFIEMFDSTETLRANNATLLARWKWEENFQRINEYRQKLTMLQAGAESFNFLAVEGVKLATLWVAVMLFCANKLSMGQMIACFFLAERIVGPVSRIFQSFLDLVRLRASLDRFDPIFSARSESSHRGSKSRKPSALREKQSLDSPREHSIVFENVAYRYGHFAENIIEGVNFKIRKGEKVAIVGASGSGKSTMVSLMNGLRLPSSGSVLIDGEELTPDSIDSVRMKIGYVSQSGQLFHGTILDNITMHDPDASVPKAVSAAKLVGAEEFITRLPGAFSTVIERGGVGLSEGQVQSVLMARVVYLDPEIIVLDEATSHFDTISEENLTRVIMSQNSKKTVVFVTQHINLLSKADTILVMNDGLIIDQGRHYELMKRCEFYYRLFSQQLALQ